RGQLHLLAQTLQYAHLSVVYPGQHHMKAVGAQGYGRDQWQVHLLFLRHARFPYSACAEFYPCTAKVSAPCDKLLVSRQFPQCVSQLPDGMLSSVASASANLFWRTS